jgi:tRNA 2-thiouridine synthesizing protein A
MDIAMEINTSGMNCPLPVIKTGKMMNEMQPGQIIKVIATDPTSCNDIEVFCRQTGNELVKMAKLGDSFTFLIKKSGGAEKSMAVRI